MNCDICNKEISSSEIARIPIKEMQKAVRSGFNPFKTSGIDMSLATGLTGMFGLSTADLYQDWRQRVLADTTDWGLCPNCAKAFRKAAK